MNESHSRKVNGIKINVFRRAAGVPSRGRIRNYKLRRRMCVKVNSVLKIEASQLT